MGTLILNEMRKRASGFLNEKYRTARLVLTDVTPAELLAEEATNNDPWGPDAKTMTRIAEASYDVDDYWRIVDVLHARFYNLDLKDWRQCYKSLVLLEFLLTHGPEDLAEEFLCDLDVIQELETFKHVDEKGFDWGASMQKKSERILKLLSGGEFLREARLKAIKVTREIKGFGNLILSPTSSTSPTTPSPSSSSSGASSRSFGSINDSEGSSKPDLYEHNKVTRDGCAKDDELSKEKSKSLDSGIDENIRKLHLWESSMEESGNLLDTNGGAKHDQTFLDGIRSRFSSVTSPSKIRSISDVGREMKRKFDRQFSLGY